MLWILVVLSAAAILIVANRMADPTATVAQDWRPYNGKTTTKMTGSEVLVQGAYVEELFSTGEMSNIAAEAGSWPIGILESFDAVAPSNVNSSGAVTGTNNNDTSDYGATAIGDIILESVTVAGATAYEKKGYPVYASDGQTLTLTRPSADAAPMGFVYDMPRDHTGATDIDVFVFGKATSWLLSCAGGNKCSKFLGSVHTSALEGTAAADLFKHTLYGHGLITRVWAKPTGFGAGYVAGSQVLNLEIGTTNLTGGAVTVAYTDCDAIGDLASNIEGTAVTAANEFHDGDIVTCELAASGTGFTAAQDEVSFEIWCDIEWLPGA